MDGPVVIVVPARLKSSRFPQKPLHPLRGAGGEARPLIRRSWEAAQRVPGVDAIYIATDSARIAAEARAFGAEAIMTSEECRNGTERCAEAVERMARPPGLVVNLQGDAPLTPPHFVTALIDAARQSDAEMVTAAFACSADLLARHRRDEAAGIVGGTTVVTNRLGRALYFSKRLIPHFEGPVGDAAQTPLRMHVGLYAYRPEALRAYAALPQGELERLEGLEQLRFLENAIPVHVVDVAPPAWPLTEVNNPSDVPEVEAALAAAGLE